MKLKLRDQEKGKHNMDGTFKMNIPLINFQQGIPGDPNEVCSLVC